MIVEEQMLTADLFQFLQLQDSLHKLIITSTRNENIVLLPEKMEALFFFTEDDRRREETKRTFRLKKQKEESQRKLWTD
ncbi:hypothetical protein CRP01_08740 [Flavilitoribacter nigricans DSM 23189 = NBRC 102662]|uniref:Uncharacterized protein n=1 Tax=Flavilitoribacter nigricans (strain ATCC 23147 / DSM 23189 / NBRC 102662 / NCIMB 1420 / SS-2) TaxID=1122177 RepID=A0A2D0NEX6_FLAN2|nr:hypothetical protein CRP01_08740 [Flavilitoribacter nigricans DSM 23189 = NBRC 102662]